MSASAETKRRRNFGRIPSNESCEGMPQISNSLIVLESVDPPGPTIKYVDQIVREAPSYIEFRYFSWPTALVGRYDVFHVHWPEFLIRGRRRWVSSARRTLFRLFLLRLRLKGTRVVRTIHNLEPHDQGDATEAHLLARLDSLTTAWVRINEVTAFPPRGDHYTVLHGSYRNQFADLEKPLKRDGRILYIGRIERYKGVEDLVRAFVADRDLTAELRIVGKADEDLRKSIGAMTVEDERITSVFEFVSDERLVAEICQAELVVLPYREMHNSGIALIALSLDRPVLVPDSPTNAALASETGANWVLRYDGEISGAIIRDALASVRRAGRGSPALDNRDWSQVAQGYAAAFSGKWGVPE